MPIRKIVQPPPPPAALRPIGPLAPHQVQLILTILLLLSVFANGVLWTKVQFYEKGQEATVGQKQQGTNNTGTGNVPAAPSFGSANQVDKLRDNDHIRGSRNARILLIEYSDLECPFCKRFHPTAQQVVDEYKGQVAWIYRHFPLDQIHSKADKEAEAAECAQEIGGPDGFWKLVDKIYEVTPSNNGLDLATLPDLASRIGLDKNKLKSCLDSGKYAEYVEKDYQSGVKAGIQGTPGNILLDTKTGKTQLIPGALPFDQFKQAIDTMLKSS